METASLMERKLVASPPMSQLGQTLPRRVCGMSAFPPIATELRTFLEVRFVP
jgi:hypothetical protein